MALKTSQWLSLAGGFALVSGPLLPLAYDGERTMSLLDPGLPASAALSLEPVLAGVAMILFGASVILISTWFSTARLLLVPATVGLLVTVTLEVFAIRWLASLDMAVTVGPAAIILAVGHLLIVAAAAIDRRQYRLFVRRSART